MKKSTEKKFNILLIIINIITLGLMITSLITKQDKIYALYWAAITLMLLIQIVYVFKWEKLGSINADKKESNIIRSSFDGVTTATIVISGLVFLSVNFLEMINESIKNNIFIIVLAYLLLTISYLTCTSAVYSANRDTKKLVENLYKY